MTQQQRLGIRFCDENVSIDIDAIAIGLDFLTQFGLQHREFDELRILLDQSRMKVVACPLEYESCSSAMNSECPHSGTCN